MIKYLKEYTQNEDIIIALDCYQYESPIFCVALSMKQLLKALDSNPNTNIKSGQ